MSSEKGPGGGKWERCSGEAQVAGGAVGEEDEEGAEGKPAEYAAWKIHPQTGTVLPPLTTLQSHELFVIYFLSLDYVLHMCHFIKSWIEFEHF